MLKMVKYLQIGSFLDEFSHKYRANICYLSVTCISFEMITQSVHKMTSRCAFFVMAYPCVV